MSSDHSIEQTITELKNTYSIVGEPFYLSTFFKKDGERFFYNFLKQKYKSCYENNERILIVQDCKDEYYFDNNKAVAGESLIFLQKSLQEIDISNFFVLIVSGNPNIETEVETVRQQYSTDSIAIQTYLADINYEQKNSYTDTFCVIPWMHLYLATDANIYPCCHGDFSIPFGNVTKNSLSEITNNDNFKNLRLNMLAGKKSKTCSTCYLMEKTSTTSRRKKINDKYQNLIPLFKQQTLADGTIPNFQPKELHLALNNNCNLQCRTCSGFSSSKLAQEEKVLYNYLDNFNRTLDTNQKEQVVNSILPYLDNANQISFAGGEPSIQVEHYKILDVLIEKKLTNTAIRYNINCTKLGVKQYSLLDYWNRFTTVKVDVSLDGHGKKFEYVRSGADWEAVKNNFLKIKTQCPHVDLSVSSVVSFISVESIIELQKMWHQNAILDIGKFKIVLMLKNAEYFNIQSLPLAQKSRIQKVIEKHCDWLYQCNADKLLDRWIQVINYMNANDLTYVLPKLESDIALKDIHRNQNFYQVFPEFADIFR